MLATSVVPRYKSSLETGDGFFLFAWPLPKRKVEEKRMKAVNLSKIALAAMMACGLTACGTEKATEEDAQLSVEKEPLIVGISPDYPPFDTIDAEGNLGGLDVEMMEWVADWMNEHGSSYELEWSKMSFENLITALNSDQLDLVVSGISYDESRKVEYSEPYYESAQVMLVAEGSEVKSSEDLNGKIAAAQMGSTGEECAKTIEGAKVQTFSDAAVAVASLKSGAVDAVVMDQPAAQSYVLQGGFEILDEELQEEDNYVIAKEGNTELMAEVNEAIKAFNESDAKDGIVTKWMGGEESKILSKENIQFMLKGAGISLLLALGAIIVGCVIGILLAAAKLSHFKFLHFLSNIYIELFRGTPMLLQIMFFYLALPILYQSITGMRLRMDPYITGFLALSFNSGAYQAELIRSGIQGVDKGQWEACETLGIGYGTMMKEIILPQAFRRIVPPLVSEFITLIKDSSLISTIGAVELLYSAQILGKQYFDYVPPLLAAGVMYLCMTVTISLISKVIERRLAEHD